MKTAIVTDTNSGITVEEGRKKGIYVLPMPVIMEGECYFEGINITHEQLYQAMINNKEVSSAQPSPGDVMAMWDSILSDGYDEILYIPMSSSLSGSCHNAIQLALEYDSKVTVADNHRISVTLMESVFDAKALADKGLSACEIKTYLEEQAYQASILNIKPVLSIQGEKLDLFAKTRGIRQSEKRMLEALQNDLATRFFEIPAERLQIGTAGTFEKKEDAEKWLAYVQSTFPQCSVYYFPLSCSIACHVGINALGIGVSVLAERN